MSRNDADTQAPGGKWEEVLGSVLVVSLFACLALVAAGGWTWFAGFLAGSASAWVQAVGSVAAILGAFSISNRQVVAQRAQANEAARQERRQRLTVCRSVLQRVGSVFDSTAKSLATRGASTLLRHEAFHAEKMVDAMPLFEIPDALLVHRIGLIGQSLRHLHLGLDQVDSLQNSATIESYRSNAREWLAECRVAYLYCGELIRQCSTDAELRAYENEPKAMEAFIRWAKATEKT